YFNAYDPVSDAGFFTRIAVRPNEGTIDVGLSVWLPGTELATLHGVAPRREMTDSELAVSGVRYTRVRPMGEWRGAGGRAAGGGGPGVPGGGGGARGGRRARRGPRIGLEAPLRALAPPIGVDGQGTGGRGATAATGASVGKGHLEQAGRWTGWIEADGTRHSL